MVQQVKRRRKQKHFRSGKYRAVIDEDTVEGFALFTKFLRCSVRSDLWHLPPSQAATLLALPSKTLCGIEPYRQASEMRNDWHGFERVKVCTACRELYSEL